MCTLGSLVLWLVLCTPNLMAEGVLHSTAQNVSLSQSSDLLKSVALTISFPDFLEVLNFCVSPGISC